MESLPPRGTLHQRRAEPLRLHRLDRLSSLNRHLPVWGLLALLTGCGSAEPQAGPSRVEAVKAPAARVEADKWCDKTYAGPDAPALSLPAHAPARDAGAAPDAPADGWVWLNVWATWCGPCKQEMPLIGRFSSQLQKDGIPLQVWYLSVDEKREDVDRYLQANPETAPGVSVQLSQLSDLEPWIKSLGLDAASSIPIQVLAGPGGKVRCVRAGSVHEGDFATLKTLMSR